MPDVPLLTDDLIQADGLTKTYNGKTPVTALSNVSFTLRRGELAALAVDKGRDVERAVFDQRKLSNLG